MPLFFIELKDEIWTQAELSLRTEGSDPIFSNMMHGTLLKHIQAKKTCIKLQVQHLKLSLNSSEISP